jgi:hypothetical protein
LNPSTGSARPSAATYARELDDSNVPHCSHPTWGFERQQRSVSGRSPGVAQLTVSGTLRSLSLHASSGPNDRYPRYCGHSQSWRWPSTVQGTPMTAAHGAELTLATLSRRWTARNVGGKADIGVRSLTPLRTGGLGGGSAAAALSGRRHKNRTLACLSSRRLPLFRVMVRVDRDARATNLGFHANPPLTQQSSAPWDVRRSVYRGCQAAASRHRVRRLAC